MDSTNMIYPKYTKEQLQSFDDFPSGVLINVKDGKGSLKFAYANRYFASFLGYTYEELTQLLTENCFAAIYDEDMEKARASRKDVLAGKIVNSISRQKKKDGSPIWIRAHIRQIELDGVKGMLFLFSTIQDLIGLQDELSLKNREFADIIDSIPIGLVVYKIDNGITKILAINKALLEVANYVGTMIGSRHERWTGEELSDMFCRDMFAVCEEDDIPRVNEMLHKSEKGETTHCTFRLRGSVERGTTIYLYSTCASRILENQDRIYYVTYQDVTETENRKRELYQKQTMLYNMSYYDALTGVKNRNAYNEFKKFCRNNRIYNVGLAFCDLNGLKHTNDTLGHQYGDQMLCRFVSVLEEYFDVEYIYRLSGDEFVVIQPEIERSDFQGIVGNLSKRMQEEDNLASIGFIWKANVSDIQRRTTQAEQIMYVEKQRYYEESRTINSKHRPKFLESLLKDFENGRFVMYLQPKTAIDDSKIIGAEALARKIGPDGKLVPPYEFVPLLEHEKLIPKLDLYILELVCSFLQEQHRLGIEDFSVSVNISRVTIVEMDFIKTVEDMLNKYQFLHKNLELELTESNETMDSIRLEEYMVQLKKLGVKISLDDVGNDYSSLNMLIMEGVDWIKLDRSLILKLGQEKADKLLKHVINMSHDLNIKVIAEGVETDKDRILLKEMNCDAYQGYLKSKPIPKEEFVERFLR